MIRVTVELVPHGIEGRKKHLGTAEIWNDATGNLATGNYGYRLSRRGQPNSDWKSGEVKGFPRKRLGGWDLLFRALRNAVADRN